MFRQGTSVFSVCDKNVVILGVFWYNSDNINDELFNYYFNLGPIINSSCKMILKLENIYDVLFYINRNIENFNKDELILSKSILKTTKYVIDKAKNQKNVEDEVLSYCDNLQNEIKDKLKEPNL